METTQVLDTKTVAEIQTLLAQKASSVMVEYAEGKVESVSFRVQVEGQAIPFRLPCRWKTVEAALRRSGKRPKGKDTYEQWARRVAWRQIKRWVEAQLAIVETGMVSPQEVFLPYMLTGGGQTMFELVAERQFLALESKPPKEPS